MMFLVFFSVFERDGQKITVKSVSQISQSNQCQIITLNPSVAYRLEGYNFRTYGTPVSGGGVWRCLAVSGGVWRCLAV